MKTDFQQLFPDIRETGETKLRQAQLVMLRMLKIIDYICRKHNIGYWLCSGTLLGAVRHKGFIPWDDDLDICMIRQDYNKFLKIAPMEFPNDIFLQTSETDPEYDYLPLPCKVRDKNSLIISEGMENKKYQQGLFIDIFPADRYHKSGLRMRYERGLKSYFRFITKCLDAKLGAKRSYKNMAIALLEPIFRHLTLSYKKHIKHIITNNLSLKNDECFIGHGLDTPWRRYFEYYEIYPLKDIEFEDAIVKAPNNTHSYLTQLYGKNYMTPPSEKDRIQKHSQHLQPIKNAKEEIL